MNKKNSNQFATRRLSLANTSHCPHKKHITSQRTYSSISLSVQFSTDLLLLQYTRTLEYQYSLLLLSIILLTSIVKRAQRDRHHRRHGEPPSLHARITPNRLPKKCPQWHHLQPHIFLSRVTYSPPPPSSPSNKKLLFSVTTLLLEHHGKGRQKGVLRNPQIRKKERKNRKTKISLGIDPEKSIPPSAITG